MDLSAAIMDRAMLHSDCTSHIPNLRIRGRLCRTNQASNTAFRGFGGPQAMLIANTWMNHVGSKLGLSFEQMQECNMYKEGQSTHFGQVLEHDRLAACWHEAKELADWQTRRAEVDAYNARSR
jgi:xanthine dehydrogenase/oxidase